MMSDRRITGWLDCLAWLIDHPQRRILVDTGENAAFGTPAYFADVPRSLAKSYPKIIDATARDGNDLARMLAAAGFKPGDLELCVLTHTHSDHVGNLDHLDRSTRLLVSPEELVPGGRGGGGFWQSFRRMLVYTRLRGRSTMKFLAPLCR